MRSPIPRWRVAYQRIGGAPNRITGINRPRRIGDLDQKRCELRFGTLVEDERLNKGRRMQFVALGAREAQASPV